MFKYLKNSAEYERFRDGFLALLSTPIESGSTHPTDEILPETITCNKEKAVAWMVGVYLETDSPAQVLLSIGRLDAELALPWALAIMKNGLENLDICVRDVCVQALEHWRGQESLAILKRHAQHEPTPWLKTYITRVIEEMESETATVAACTV